jgi:cAMP-dependent protein kinase regulator
MLGAPGDYFYIVQKGSFTVLVDGKPVAQIGDGHQAKSFGELSLIYDVPRQATVRADTNGSLFALDRNTYRFTIANSYERKNHDISEAVQKVPLLKNLTPAQMEKLIETVELTTYNEGMKTDMIIVSIIYLLF